MINNEITNNPLVQIYELKFIQKIIEDNQLFNETKVKYNMFQDPLAKVIFNIMGINIGRLGEFKPLIHLKDLCDDQIRLEKFNSIGYPMQIVDPQSIVDYFNLFSDDSVKSQTLERFIEDQFIKNKLSDIATKIHESVDSSTIDVRNFLIQTSIGMDNLLYSAEDEVIVKDETKLVDDFLGFLSNPEVESYVKTGVDIIDKLSGGTPNQALISWVACAKAGKSMLLVDSIVDNLRRGRNCIFFSIEMSEEQVFQRMIARYAEFPFEKIAKKELSHDDIKYLTEKAKEFRDKYSSQLEIYQNRSGICVKNIEAHIARKIRAGQKVDDIFVDYLQILNEPTKVNKVEQMEELCKQLRQLCQKLKLRIFVPAQLGSATRDKKIEEIHDGDIWWAKNLAKFLVCA